MWRTRILLSSLVLVVLNSCQPEASEVEANLREIRASAATYLLNQQAEDGGWHSATHGILRGGQAYTPYMMDVLLEMYTPKYAPTSLVKGYGFLQQSLDTTGVLGRTNRYVVEYPVYATALAYKIWPQRLHYRDANLPAPSHDFLLAEQYIESRGIAPEHPAYGGWGFGEANLPHGEVGHLDLSHTRRVLEALAARSWPDTSRVWPSATVFLARVQQSDGGFCASTYTLGANKADHQDQTGVSYATATADGVLALLALPEPPAAAIRAARAWLLTNENWAAPSGIKSGQPGDWDRVLYYYHLSVRAQAYAALGIESDWRAALLAQLQAKQSADGSFSNPWGAPNKEDDPLLATALVIKAINAAVAP